MAAQKFIPTVEQIKTKIASDPQWTERAVIAIYRKQTSDEQLVKQTTEHNNIGFNGVDAPILSSFAQQLINRQGYHLSPKQLAIAQKKMIKYAAQLHQIASTEEPPTSVKDPGPTTVVAPKVVAATQAARHTEVQTEVRSEFAFYTMPRPMPMGESRYHFHILGNKLVVFNEDNERIVTVVYPTSEGCELNYNLLQKGQFLPGFDKMLATFVAESRNGQYIVKPNPWLGE